MKLSNMTRHGAAICSLTALIHTACPAATLSDSFGNSLIKAGYSLSSSEVADLYDYNLEAEAEAWGKAFGVKRTIASATLKAGSESFRSRLYGKLEVFDTYTFTLDKKVKTELDESLLIFQKKKTLGEYTVPIAGIPLTIKAKASATCYLDYEAGYTLSPELMAYAKVEPKIDAAGEASVEIDALIASAGVRTSVSFLELGVPCKAGVRRADGGYEHFRTLKLRLESLSGRMRAFVQFLGETYSKTIFEWNGFTNTYTLESGTDFVPEPDNSTTVFIH